MCLASGSSGNCYYLGNENGGILIDVGIPIKDIRKALIHEGVSLENGDIKAILITHNHADHIRTVGQIVSNYHCPVYASHKVHQAIANCRYIYEDLSAYRRYVSVEKPTELIGFTIESFVVPHDSKENYGYHISKDNFKFTLATDIGSITPAIEHYTAKANYLVVEANYDEDLLFSGDYPAFLKKRVSGPLGHLSNRETGELISKIYHQNLKIIWLCHLSKENNNPELCLKTIDARLFLEGIRVGKDLQLHTLKRHTPSQMYILD